MQTTTAPGEVTPEGPLCFQFARRSRRLPKLASAERNRWSD